MTSAALWIASVVGLVWAAGQLARIERRTAMGYKWDYDGRSARLLSEARYAEIVDRVMLEPELMVLAGTMATNVGLDWSGMDRDEQRAVVAHCLIYWIQGMGPELTMVLLLLTNPDAFQGLFRTMAITSEAFLRTVQATAGRGNGRNL